MGELFPALRLFLTLRYDFGSTEFAHGAGELYLIAVERALAGHFDLIALRVNDFGPGNFFAFDLAP